MMRLSERKSARSSQLRAGRARNNNNNQQQQKQRQRRPEQAIVHERAPLKLTRLKAARTEPSRGGINIQASCNWRKLACLEAPSSKLTGCSWLSWLALGSASLRTRSFWFESELCELTPLANEQVIAGPRSNEEWSRRQRESG